MEIEVEERDGRYYIKIGDREYGPYRPGQDVEFDDLKNLKKRLIDGVLDGNYTLESLSKIDEKLEEFREIISRPIEIIPSEYRAEYINSKVAIKGRVVGIKDGLAIPRKISLYCRRCGGAWELDTIEYEDILTDFIIGRRPDFNRLPLGECEKGKSHNLYYTPIDYMNLTLLFLRDPLLNEKEIGYRLGGERRLYVYEGIPPPARSIRAVGKLVTNNRTIVGISNIIEPIEDEYTTYKINEEDKKSFEEYFKDKTLNDLIYEIAPGMHKREEYQKALLLLTHSSLFIPSPYNHEVIRGALRVLAFGDTKCYKTRAGLDLVQNLGIGEYVMVETSSRTGIAYTIDPDTRTIIWGVLPQNDGGLVVLDGLHTLWAEEVKELREALEQMRIKVRRTVQGDIWARTRILGIMNPNKEMAEYVYRCQALKDSRLFKDPPDITRWDIFIPFSISDVPPNMFIGVKPKERPIPIDVFRRHVFWAWSLKPNDIIYTNEAVKRIEEESQDFIEKYALNDVPVVHNGYMEVLARVSVAYAVATHNVNNEYKVIVDMNAVEETIKYLDDLLSLDLELDAYKSFIEGERVISRNEAIGIYGDIARNPRAIEILSMLIEGPRSSIEIASKLNVSDRTIKDDFKVLRRHGLITAKTGVGAVLTPRGARFMKLYRSGLGGVENGLQM